MIMKTKLNLFHARCICAVALGIGSSFGLAVAAGREVGSVERGALERQGVELSLHAPRSDAPRLAWSQIGAKAGADYQGDGLAVSPTAEGARLRCVFQRLEGEATRKGLWLTSTVTNGVSDRFRVTAAEVGRAPVVAQPSRLRVKGASSPRSASGDGTSPELAGEDACATSALPRTGMVTIDGQTVRCTRPGLVEEYSVSMDGVRQDFIIEYPPLNPAISTLNQRPGELVVRLAVSGAKVEPVAGGAQLVLKHSGRKIAYSRLRVTDSTGKELTARMEVLQSNL
jgi:hypothetical protein